MYPAMQPAAALICDMEALQIPACKLLILFGSRRIPIDCFRTAVIRCPVRKPGVMLRLLAKLPMQSPELQVRELEEQDQTVGGGTGNFPLRLEFQRKEPCVQTAIREQWRLFAAEMSLIYSPIQAETPSPADANLRGPPAMLAQDLSSVKRAELGVQEQDSPEKKCVELHLCTPTIGVWPIDDKAQWGEPDGTLWFSCPLHHRRLALDLCSDDEVDANSTSNPAEFLSSLSRKVPIVTGVDQGHTCSLARSHAPALGLGIIWP
ncbi:hypothetical protein UY3_01015 [Chelonia mydas]|uniref:Uncharacterized protein n=1 Tax=Chelonia mydas TaxID=8469 RepID=M7BWX8_CHEMY|nr:hypothetical protein UY3_01015 [Chelonia mydas]